MKFALIFSLVLNIIFIATISVKLYLRTQNNKKINIIDDTYWRDKNSVYKILNMRTNGGIFFVGDSMVERFRVKEFFPSLPVFNRGNAWDDTQSLLVRLEDSVVSGNPSAVIIYIGGNDIYYGVEPEITARNMRSIIDELKLHGISISVLSILPVWHDNKRDNKDIEQLNLKIKKLCIETSVSYIDVTNGFSNSSGELRHDLSNDGVHLNGLGYQALTGNIASFLGIDE